MNKCAKINSKALPNGIVIGEELFQVIRPFEDKYSFITVDESVPGIDGKYLGRFQYICFVYCFLQIRLCAPYVFFGFNIHVYRYDK